MRQPRGQPSLCLEPLCCSLLKYSLSCFLFVFFLWISRTDSCWLSLCVCCPLLSSVAGQSVTFTQLHGNAARRSTRTKACNPRTLRLSCMQQSATGALLHDAAEGPDRSGAGTPPWPVPALGSATAWLQSSARKPAAHFALVTDTHSRSRSRSGKAQEGLVVQAALQPASQCQSI